MSVGFGGVDIGGLPTELGGFGDLGLPSVSQEVLSEGSSFAPGGWEWEVLTQDPANARVKIRWKLLIDIAEVIDAQAQQRKLLDRIKRITAAYSRLLGQLELALKSIDVALRLADVAGFVRFFGRELAVTLECADRLLRILSDPTLRVSLRFPEKTETERAVAAFEEVLYALTFPVGLGPAKWTYPFNTSYSILWEFYRFTLRAPSSSSSSRLHETWGYWTGDTGTIYSGLWNTARMDLGPGLTGHLRALCETARLVESAIRTFEPPVELQSLRTSTASAELGAAVPPWLTGDYLWMFVRAYGWRALETLAQDMFLPLVVLISLMKQATSLRWQRGAEFNVGRCAPC